MAMRTVAVVRAMAAKAELMSRRWESFIGGWCLLLWRFRW